MKRAQVPTIEQIEEFLTKYGVCWTRDVSAGFNRNIDFVIYGVRYRIEWFINGCRLRILNDHEDSRYAHIPFLNLSLCTTAPIAPTANRSIMFYTFVDDNNRPIWESFRIPLHLS